MRLDFFSQSLFFAMQLTIPSGEANLLTEKESDEVHRFLRYKL